MREFIVRCENNKFTLEGEIIHCEDCEFCTVEEPISRGIIPDMYCRIWQSSVSTDDSCSYGERKENHQLSGETSTISEETSTNEGDADKLKNPCDSLLKPDSDECKEQKSKLDCISRQQAINAVENTDINITESEWDELISVINNLPPVTPTVKVRQVDTIIIAAALQNFAQDSERNISDRERAEELREQVLAYGASMCKPVTPTVSEDCISRANLPKKLNGVVLDNCDKIVEEFLEEHECDELWNVVRALRDFYEWTIDAPSVIPTERTGWIPVSERLPEKNGDYIVSLEDAVDTSASFFNGKWFMSSFDCISREYGEYEVIAWMPLPEPYKGV